MNSKYSHWFILTFAATIAPASLLAQTDRSLEETYAEKCRDDSASELCKVLKEAVDRQAAETAATEPQQAPEGPETAVDVSAIYAEANAEGLENLQRTQEEIERVKRETEQYERDLAARQAEVARYNAEMEEVRRKEAQYQADLEKSRKAQEAYLAKLSPADRRKALAGPAPAGTAAADPAPAEPAAPAAKQEKKKKQKKVCLAETATGSIMARRVCRKTS